VKALGIEGVGFTGGNETYYPAKRSRHVSGSLGRTIKLEGLEKKCDKMLKARTTPSSDERCPGQTLLREQARTGRERNQGLVLTIDKDISTRRASAQETVEEHELKAVSHCVDVETGRSWPWRWPLFNPMCSGPTSQSVEEQGGHGQLQPDHNQAYLLPQHLKFPGSPETKFFCENGEYKSGQHHP